MLKTLKTSMMLCAAVLASGLTFGSTSGASAHGRAMSASGCCGPVAPIYVHHNAFKTVNKYVHRVVHKTEHFVRPRQVYHVSHLHVRTNVHVLTDVRITKVGHIVDHHHFKTVVSNSTHYFYKVRTSVHCICGPHKSHCS
jgi:inorganic pyrophosphatase/exopolyphosphatase